MSKSGHAAMDDNYGIFWAECRSIEESSPKSHLLDSLDGKISPSSADGMYFLSIPFIFVLPFQICDGALDLSGLVSFSWGRTCGLVGGLMHGEL